MTKSSYPFGWGTGSQESGKAASRAVWVVNFNNGNSNDYNRNNNACVRAVRSVSSGEYQDAGAQQVTLRALHRAWKAARRGKLPSQNLLDFEARWADGLLALQRELNSGSWKPRPSTCFIATRPKAREIHAPDFADRVVHHWLVPQLEAIYEPRFIFDSYANRKGKGSHAAVVRLQQFVREVESGQGGGWYLQLDIHNFFNSIHRATLWSMLKPVLTKAGLPLVAMHAAHALLRSPPLQAGVTTRATPTQLALVPPHKRLVNAATGCGLPIGNLSSQFLANVYLDQLDQFVKHVLKAKRYLRYVDDFVLVHQDREQLAAWQQQIERFLADRLRLSLKADIKLRRLGDGADFLGYVVRPTHTLVRRRVVAHMRAAMADWEAQHVDGKLIQASPASLRGIQSTAASYAGHLKHASAMRLQCAIRARFDWLGVATRRRKFHYRLEGRQITILYRGKTL